MKVATILLAIAVASVSAKHPAPEVVTTKHEPAVRENAKESARLLGDSFKYGAQSGVDLLREGNDNIVRPTGQVIGGTAGGVAHDTAGYTQRRVGDFFGAVSAVEKVLGRASEGVTNFLYNRAATNSRKFEDWHGASVHHDEAAAADFESAKQPLRNAAETVKETSADVKDKLVDVKNKGAAKLEAGKEEVKDHAEDAKENVQHAGERSSNFFKKVFHSGKANVGKAGEVTGEKVTELGEKIQEKSGNLRARSEDRVEEIEHDQLKLAEKDSGASSIALSGAAIAVASAAAVYLI